MVHFSKMKKLDKYNAKRYNGTPSRLHLSRCDCTLISIPKHARRTSGPTPPQTPDAMHTGTVFLPASGKMPELSCWIRIRHGQLCLVRPSFLDFVLGQLKAPNSSQCTQLLLLQQLRGELRTRSVAAPKEIYILLRFAPVTVPSARPQTAPATYRLIALYHPFITRWISSR